MDVMFPASPRKREGRNVEFWKRARQRVGNNWYLSAGLWWARVGIGFVGLLPEVFPAERVLSHTPIWSQGLICCSMFEPSFTLSRNGYLHVQ